MRHEKFTKQFAKTKSPRLASFSRPFSFCLRFGLCLGASPSQNVDAFHCVKEGRDLRSCRRLDEFAERLHRPFFFGPGRLYDDRRLHLRGLYDSCRLAPRGLPIL